MEGQSQARVSKALAFDIAATPLRAIQRNAAMITINEALEIDPSTAFDNALAYHSLSAENMLLDLAGSVPVLHFINLPTMPIIKDGTGRLIHILGWLAVEFVVTMAEVELSMHGTVKPADFQHSTAYRGYEQPGTELGDIDPNWQELGND